MQLDLTELYHLIDKAIAEDIHTGDITTNSLISDSARATANFVFRQQGIVCGIPIVEAIFERLNISNLKFYPNVIEGSFVREGTNVFTVSGSAKAILTYERIALNFLQYLSGIATTTRTYVDLISHTKAKILDTRKTLPAYRSLAKYAVWIGGGQNHRKGLYDAILIKDNHLQIFGSVKDAVLVARKQNPDKVIEIECDTLEQFVDAISANPDIILLDNMTNDMLSQAVAINKDLGSICKLEASGGVNLSTLKAIAETGVDLISVGALTHSVKAIDVGLDFV